MHGDYRLVNKWRIVFTSAAQKDAGKITRTGLKPKTESLLKLLEEDPFRSPPPFEKLVGELKGAFSRRISLQHRLIYQIIESTRTVKILRMWTHYEE